VDVSDGQQVVVHRGTLHIIRSRFLWHDVAYEQVRMVNYALEPLKVPLRLSFAADFADIFEVRGMRRERRGRRLEDEVKADSILMTYEGLDGEQRRTRINCDPEPIKITSSELYFEADLRPGKAADFQFSIACNPELPHSVLGYNRAMAGADAELKAVSS